MMARLAICAVGLALAAPSARAGHGPWAPLDQTGLFQKISKDSAEASFNAEQGVLAEESGGLSDQPGYALDDYKVGMLVEVRTPRGQWVPGALQALHPQDVWDVKTQGQDLQGVPAKWLRRRLDEGESDWAVIGTGLKTPKAFGCIAYRLSKNLKDFRSTNCGKGTEGADVNSLVVGREEADGWLKVSRGYLPMRLNGVQVLSKRDRRHRSKLTKELRDWYLEAEEARLKAAMAKLELELPPPQTYADHEEVLFQTGDGKWRPARVVSHELATYKVLVRPRAASEYEVSRVWPAQLRKAGPPKQKGSTNDSPTCQKAGGCIELLLMTDSSTGHKVKVGLGTPIHFLMKMACDVIQFPKYPRNCLNRIQLRHLGLISPSWRTFEAGLTNGTLVDVKLAPESVTPMGEVSE